MNEKILKNIEKLQESKEELIEYLTDLKNKGILTQRQVNAIMNEYFKEDGSKINTRTPKTMEYAYSNVSAGFSKTGMLVLLAMSVPVLVGMIVLLNK